MIALVLLAALQTPPAASTPAVPEISQGEPVQKSALHNQREAATLYLKGAKLLAAEQTEPAWKLLKQAADLEPTNATYTRAAELAKQSLISQWVVAAVKLAGHGDRDASMALLNKAHTLDPENPIVNQHLSQAEAPLAAAATGAPVGTQASSLAEPQPIPGAVVPLRHGNLPQSFHLRSNQPQVIQQVFKAYGIVATVDDSVLNRPIRLDADDANFEQAMHLLSLATHTFFVPLDPLHVLVAIDNREKRTQLEDMAMETLSLPGLTSTELTDVGNLAKNVFDAQQSAVEPTAGTLTIRAPSNTIDAFNRTVSQLIAGHAQVDLNVKVIEIAHTSARETGTATFQQTGAYNALSEVNSIIQQNQSAVQQIISSGLVPDADTLTHKIEIVLILLAAGQLSGPPFNQGLIGFGNGITGSILAVSPATLNMTLNSSDTRALDDVNLRLADQETGTFRTGERYPIETSQFSALALSTAATAGYGNQTIPQVQYEDLGLTLKATPKIMRSNDIALTLELKIEALGGSSLNSIPVLNNRSLAAVMTLREGETAMVVSDLNRQESRALSGNPGICDIPGMQDVSDVKKDVNVARLLILVTPNVVREPSPPGKGPILLIDKGSSPVH